MWSSSRATLLRALGRPTRPEPNYRTMPGALPDEESGSSESDSLLDRGQRKVKRFWDGFIDFAFQGNILQIAFGLMYVMSDVIVSNSD